LRHRPVLHKFFGGEPLFFLDQFALHHRQHATKALQRNTADGPEQGS
jgi:hypothetical protein